MNTREMTLVWATLMSLSLSAAMPIVVPAERDRADRKAAEELQEYLAEEEE